MSQEEEARSQRSIEPLSRLPGDDLESLEVEVCTEGSDNYECDSDKEIPSFALDPQEDLSEGEAEEFATPEAGKRVSSTDNQFLESDTHPALKPFDFDYNQDNNYSVWPPRHPSSESELFEERLLPREL